MSSRITVAPTKDYFLRDGKPFFLLADTVWTAFYNPSEIEWAYYLDYRKEQGYNAIQISTTTMWDGGASDQNIYPFAFKEGNYFDFHKINAAYFERARRLLQAASDKGFIPIIIILHASYAAGTWAEKVNTNMTMPIDAMEKYAAYTVDAFKEYHPLYIVAGDTDLKNEVTLEYFRTALKTVKEHDPDGLTCFHLTPETDLPEEFVHSPLLDFYILQPGHQGGTSSRAYSLMQEYYHKPVKRPIVNGEFFYEGHGYTGKLYGRHNEFDQRKAMWQSVLAGSKTGIGYGAQGVWGWYKQNKVYRGIEYGGRAFPWQTALQFTGAWEGSFVKFLFEQYALYDIEPCDIVVNEHAMQRSEIRAAMSPYGDKIAVYIPYSVDVRMNIDLTGYKLSLIEMTHKYFGEPEVVLENGVSVLRMPMLNSDYLLIGSKDGL